MTITNDQYSEDAAGTPVSDSQTRKTSLSFLISFQTGVISEKTGIWLAKFLPYDSLNAHPASFLCLLGREKDVKGQERSLSW